MRRALTLALVLLAACSDPPPDPPAACGEPGVICTVAGSGAQSFNGDGHAPAATAFDLPSVARVGPDGLLYVMDFNNYRLRCVIDGAIDTVAGSGEHATAIDGAPALESPLENPIDVAFAPDGQPILVSIHDPRVLRLEADGRIVSIAGSGEIGDGGDGGPASEAQFDELAAIAIAPDGTIYLSDDLRNRVRVIHPDGTVDAYAGTGEKGDGGDGGPATEAQLYHPEGLAIHPSGDLYIADSYNHRIRKVDKDTGIIETVAGSTTRGFSGDGGPATDAELQWPKGIAFDAGGHLYIADTFNHRIRRVDADSGIISTIAGGEKGYAGDGGPAVDARLSGPAYLDIHDGTLYVADQRNHVIRALLLDTP